MLCVFALSAVVCHREPYACRVKHGRCDNAVTVRIQDALSPRGSPYKEHDPMHSLCISLNLGRRR
jgi:hypothetical protein